jgi:hypothetical protein
MPGKLVGMNGELAQLICLATYGTVWLRDASAADKPEPPDLTRNTTFKYAHSTEFARQSSTVLVDPSAWLRDLHVRGCRRLWLDLPEVVPARARWPYLEPHLEVAFANSGRWYVLATGALHAEQWGATWSVIEPRPADNHIWAVSYAMTVADGARPLQPDVGQANSALDRALTDARDFARRSDEAGWAAQFDEAIGATDDRPPYQPDMMDPSFPDDARRLIAKASRAWVFGGMGSWNDLGLADETKRTEHAEISRLLFATLLQACLAAVNCPLPD